MRYREMFSDVSGTQMCYVFPCFLTMLSLELWKLRITRLEPRETTRHLWRVQGWSGYCWGQNKGAGSRIFVTSLELLDQVCPGFRTSVRSLIWNNYFICSFKLVWVGISIPYKIHLINQDFQRNQQYFDFLWFFLIRRMWLGWGRNWVRIKLWLVECSTSEGELTHTPFWRMCRSCNDL